MPGSEVRVCQMGLPVARVDLDLTRAQKTLLDQAHALVGPPRVRIGPTEVHGQCREGHSEGGALANLEPPLEDPKRGPELALLDVDEPQRAVCDREIVQVAGRFSDP